MKFGLLLYPGVEPIDLATVGVVRELGAITAFVNLYCHLPGRVVFGNGSGIVG